MKVPIFLLALCFSLSLSGQSWNWSSDGYVSGSGGGTYADVDGQGTEMTVSGLVNDFAACTVNDACIHVGIDDQESEGLQHEYQFSFSNPVTLHFNIDEINEGFLCYTDLLSFTGNPEFSNASDVLISGNEVIPQYSHPVNGFVTVTYRDVTEFTITHGDGVSCNPGHVHISSLHFGLPTSTNTDFLPLEQILVYPNPVQDQFTIENNSDTPIQIALINAQGQLLNEEMIASKAHAFFNTLPYPAGIYFAQFRREGRLIQTEKVMIQR